MAKRIDFRISKKKKFIIAEMEITISLAIIISDKLKLQELHQSL